MYSIFLWLVSHGSVFNFLQLYLDGEGLFNFFNQLYLYLVVLCLDM